MKVTFDSGHEAEIEMPGAIADATVAYFARYVAEGIKPENRQIINDSQSSYIDYSKVTMIRREF